MCERKVCNHLKYNIHPSNRVNFMKNIIIYLHTLNTCTYLVHKRLNVQNTVHIMFYALSLKIMSCYHRLKTQMLYVIDIRLYWCCFFGR